MRDESYWSYREASPPELFGESDDDDRRCDACGQPWVVHRAGHPAECRYVHDEPPCRRCGEAVPGCACDRRLLDDAMREAREGEG